MGAKLPGSPRYGTATFQANVRTVCLNGKLKHYRSYSLSWPGSTKRYDRDRARALGAGALSKVPSRVITSDNAAFDGRRPCLASLEWPADIRGHRRWLDVDRPACGMTRPDSVCRRIAESDPLSISRGLGPIDRPSGRSRRPSRLRIKCRFWPQPAAQSASTLQKQFRRRTGDRYSGESKCRDAC